MKLWSKAPRTPYSTPVAVPGPVRRTLTWTLVWRCMGPPARRRHQTGLRDHSRPNAAARDEVAKTRTALVRELEEEVR